MLPSDSMASHRPSGPTAALPLHADELATLSQYGFDGAAFAHLQQKLQRGEFTAEHNRVRSAIEPAVQGDWQEWPKDEEAALIALGKAAIAAGQVGVAILNGGMATRFGGRVKGVVEVACGKSFLELKLRDLAAHAAVPLFLLNSFATDKDTRSHLQDHAHFGLPPERLNLMTQHISLRLSPAGDIFRDAAGKVGFYAPGHGDLLDCLAAHPSFVDFRKAAVGGGPKLICISNVDNLGATLDPKVIGSHLRSGKAMTTEVAARHAHDSGGAPVRRDGRVEILEGFRFPADFSMGRLQAFNTNSFVVSADAVAQAYPLTWFRADKQVGDQPVVQFERLLGELTSFVDSHFLMVPRDGPQSRFLPVKTPDDVQRVAPDIKRRFGL
jgi:UTP--glucose-1-phosphate uridylyltransferase